MPLSVDVYWSFRSPYSYLATPRMVEWDERYALDLRIRPVLPIAVRLPDFFDQVNPLWPPYLVRDVLRVGQYLGVPITWPRPDPVVQESVGGRLKTAPEQPYIHRLTRLGQLAAERGAGLRCISAVSTLIWAGTEGWNEGDHLARALASVDLDLADLDREIEAQADRLDAAIAKNQEDHEAAGHWGVPTFVFEGEPFFGQDRMDVLLWRLRQHGLEER